MRYSDKELRTSVQEATRKSSQSSITEISWYCLILTTPVKHRVSIFIPILLIRLLRLKVVK